MTWRQASGYVLEHFSSVSKVNNKVIQYVRFRGNITYLHRRTTSPSVAVKMKSSIFLRSILQFYAQFIKNISEKKVTSGFMRFKVSYSGLAAHSPASPCLHNSTTHLLLILPKIYVRLTFDAIY